LHAPSFNLIISPSN